MKMSRVVNQQAVPATRLGLTMSIAGYAVAVALTGLDIARDALEIPHSLAWVLLVILLVYPPRMITPGDGWARTRCRTTPAAILYWAGVSTAIGGATCPRSAGASAAIGTGLVTLAIAAAAATLPTATAHGPRSSKISKDRRADWATQHRQQGTSTRRTPAS